MITATSLSEAIQRYNGTITFPVEIGRIAAPGMAESLTLTYSSDVQGSARTWNLEAPTGVAGLGWTLDMSFIVRLPSLSVAESEEQLYMAVLGRWSRLVRTGTAGDGAALYKSEVMVPWTLRFYELNQRWVINDENGNRMILGDENSARSTVAEQVVWGNWFAPSSTTTGQGPRAQMWFLSERKNQFGQGFDYTYTQVAVPVGSATGAVYAQAVYLSEIRGTTGARLALDYGDKQAGVEYVVPHTNPAPPNAYQDPYQTKYLKSVSRYSRSGTLVETVTPGYGDGAGGTAFLGTTTLSKRLMTTLTRTTAKDAARPATKLVYWGQDPVADKVSATNPYDSSTKALYGALKSVLTTTGGAVNFDYTSITPHYSARDLAVAPPAPTSTAPRVRVERDFALTTWLADTGISLDLQLFTWDGRWLAETRSAIPCADQAAYAAMPLSSSGTVAGLYSGSQLHLYRSDPGRPGAWVVPEVGTPPNSVDYFNPALAAGEAASLHAARDFAGLFGSASGKLFLYNYDGAGWREETAITIGGGSATTHYAIDARGSVLVVASVPATSGSTISVELIVYKDGAFQHLAFTFANQRASSNSLAIVQGDGFAIIRTDSALGPIDVSDYAVIQWSTDYSSLSHTWFSGLGYQKSPSISESTIAVGHSMLTYDGTAWTSYDTDLITHAGQVSVDEFLPDADLCVRKIQTSTGYIYDLIAFDPNTKTWAVPTGMAIADISADAGLAAALTYGGPSNFAVVDSKVYYKNPDASWTEAGNLTIGSAGDAASLVLSGQNYAIYQSGTGTASVETNVVPLRNGVAQTAVALAGQLVNVPGKPAAELIGASAFFTYTGDFTATPALTLHRLVRGGVAGTQTAYALSAMTVDSGYQTEIAGYLYDVNYAVAQRSGWTGAYQQVSTLAGGTSVATAEIGPRITLYFNGLTANEATGLTYPTGSGSNASDYYGYIRGVAYQQSDYSKASPSTNPVRQDTTWWVVTVSRLANAGQGAYYRQSKITNMVDGVTKPTTFEYDVNGFVSQSQTSRHNSAGNEIATITAYTRWPAIYDTGGTMAAPLLAPIVQTTFSTKNITSGGDVAVFQIENTTWLKSGPVVLETGWAPFKKFTALNATPGAFTHWTDPESDPFTHDADGWRQTSVVLSRTDTGLPLDTADVDTTRTGLIYDRFNELSLCWCLNGESSAGEISYLGFETYETTTPWAWQPSGTIASHIISSDRNTGERCLSIPFSADASVGPYAAFYPQDQQATFVFGCWAKLTAAAAGGNARWKIQAYKQGDNSAVGDPIILDVTGAGQSWTLFETAIDLPAIRQQAGVADTVALYLFIQGGNAVTAASLLVDDIRFSPLKALFGATVYDAEILLQTAAVDTNGQVTRTLYNDYYDAIAAIGIGERVDEVTLPTFSRGLTDADAFLPSFGNTTLRLTTGSSSYYDDFYSAQPNTWQFTGSTWTIDTGKLNYTGTDTSGIGATAVYIKQAHTNFGASVEVVSRAPDADIAVGNGDLFVRWNAAGNVWDLVRLSGSTVTQIAANNSVTFQKQVSFVIVDGFAMAFAEGTQLFAYEYQYPSPVPENYGKLVLAATGNASFDNVAVLDDPSVTASTMDGIGRDWQSLDLVGYVPLGGSSGQFPASSSGQFFDAIGRPNVMRNPSQGALQIVPSTTGNGSVSTEDAAVDEHSLLLASPYDNLYVDGGSPLTLDEYLTGSAGVFDYTSQTYEASPLSRPSQIVLPRSDIEVAADYTIDLTYAGVAALPTIPGAPSVADDDPPIFHQETSTRLFAKNAAQTRITVADVRIGDSDGRALVELTTVSDNSVSQMTANEYNDAGQLVTVKQPNYFAPPPGSTAETWKQTWRYTFEGWVSQTTDPDTGTTQILYDRSGRARFTMTAEGAAQTPRRILYKKYDAIARIVESGYIQDATYTFADLAAKADTPGFPVIVANDPTPPLEATGAWSHRYEYDRTPTGDITNMIGRLFQVTINNGDIANPDSEQYSYDINGDPTSVKTVANSYAVGANYTIGYEYTSRGQVAKVTYPAPLPNQEDPFEIGYYYDRLARLASVGFPIPRDGVIDPDNPPTPPEMAFAAYGYDDTGRLSTVQLNSPTGSQNPVQRQMSYDGEGRLSEVTDRYLTERFSYGGGTGAGGMSYYSGQIASVARENTTNALWACPPEASSSNRFAYDGLGRITEAQSDLDFPYTTTYGDGTDGYDANGNLLKRTHGTNEETFTWKQVSGARVNNQVDAANSVATAAASIDFEGLAPDAKSSGAWSWGSSNLGPSGSAISTSDPHSGTQSLYVAGGGVGHFERLVLRTYLDPRGSYTLNAFVRTEPGFAAAQGEAAWYLTIESAARVLLSEELAVVTASSTWTAIPQISVRLAASLASLGADGQSVVISIELRNSKRGGGGATGPGLFIDDIVIAGSVTGTAYSYDLDGRVTAAPAKDLHLLEYEPVIDRTRLIQLDDAQGDKLNYGFDAAGERLTLKHTDAGGTVTRNAAVYLRGTGTSPLYAKTNIGGNETSLFRVLGLDGMVAFTSDGNWSYVANNWLGSTQLLFDETSDVSASTAFQPFGPLAKTSGNVDADTLFTGQMLSPESGLYDFHARLYDADLGRFYATDAVPGATSPYVYADNNPVTNVDPDGRMIAPSTLLTGVLVSPRARRFVGAVGGLAVSASIGTAKLGFWTAKRLFWVSPGDWYRRAFIAFWGGHFVASPLWDKLGLQWLFSGIFNNETTQSMKEFNLVGGIVKKAVNAAGEALYNFSRDELQTIVKFYPGLWPLVIPATWMIVYAGHQNDAREVQGEFGWTNEARHFFWTGRAARLGIGGSKAFAKQLAAAHERGRPAIGRRGFYDTVADKINNVFAWNYATASTEHLPDLFRVLKRQNLLALNGENNGFFDGNLSGDQSERAFEEMANSYRVSLEHLESKFGEIPEFSEMELQFLEKATGWTPR